MSNPVESSSKHLSQILNSIIGTQEAIKSKRMRVTKLYRSEKRVIRYIIGSMCDCLSLTGVDFDFLYVHQHLPVVDTLSGDGTDSMPLSNYLVACFSPSSSAYMCLEMHIHVQLRDMLSTRQHVIDDLCVIYYNDSLLVSSFLFLQHNSRVDGGALIGPSQMNLLNMVMDNDNVQAFHCKYKKEITVRHPLIKYH